MNFKIKFNLTLQDRLNACWKNQFWDKLFEVFSFIKSDRDVGLYR